MIHIHCSKCDKGLYAMLREPMLEDIARHGGNDHEYVTVYPCECAKEPAEVQSLESESK